MNDGGVKGALNSGISTTARQQLTCQPSRITPIKFLVKNNNYESLASYFRNLCGPFGHAQIVEHDSNLQIHFFFDSQRQRDLFKQDLENDFNGWRVSTLAFDDFQTEADPQHSDLYSLKLTTSQSVVLLYNAGTYNFPEGQNFLRETQEYLDLKKSSLDQSQIIPLNTNAPQDLVTTAPPGCSFVPDDNRHHFISGFCSWLPLKSVLDYAAICRSAFQFIMDDNDFWKLRALVYGIQLNPVIPPKLQVVPWEQAKFFEDKYKSVLDYAEKCRSAVESIVGDDEFGELLLNSNSDIPPKLQVALEQLNFFSDEYKKTHQDKSSHFGKAAGYHITAAKLGVPEAIMWLESSLASATLLTSTQRGEIFLILGDFYGKMENPGQKLVEKYHESAWKYLNRGAHRGCSDAILVLYDRDIGDRPASKINKVLEAMLLENMRDASWRSCFATTWILDVFSRDAKLPLYFKERSKQALLTVFNKIRFNTESGLNRCAHHLVNELKFDQVRLLIEAKLNKLFGTQDNPIALCYSWFELPISKLLISPTNENDTARFIEAVKQPNTAHFFVPVSNVVLNDACLAYKNCIEITEKSWKQFKALISK